LPTISLSSGGTSLKILLKSSLRDLYVGYNTLYHDDFFLLRSEPRADSLVRSLLGPSWLALRFSSWTWLESDERLRLSYIYI